jgi:hypothetical protein
MLILYIKGFNDVQSVTVAMEIMVTCVQDQN